MADILNESGVPIGKIEQDGDVLIKGERVGRVTNGRDVLNREGNKIGYYEGGHVYEGSSRIGRIEPDGRVFNKDDHYAGKTVGGHIYEGGAALLLLID